MTLSLYNRDNGALDFDSDGLSLTKIPVRYQGKDYLLVEALGDAVATWRNAQLRGTTMQQIGDSDTRTIALGGMADSEPLLVHLCLFTPDKDGNLILDKEGNVVLQRRVSLHIVKNWPNRILSRLFEKAKEISGLDQTETAEALEKQIAALQSRLAKLRKSGEPSEEEALAKN